MQKMKISKIRSVKTPTRGTEKSAGLDFFVPDDFPEYSILPQRSVKIPSGIKAEVLKNHALIAFNKSGVATNKGLIVGAEVVDEDYQGEIHIHLINTTEKIVCIGPGEKITQFLLIPVSYVEPVVVSEKDLFSDTTERGEGGFGSTGTK